MEDAGGTGPRQNDDSPPGSMSASLGVNTSFQGTLIDALSPLETKPWSPERQRERLRGCLAVSLVVAFLALTAFFVLGVTFKWLDMATAKDLAPFTLTPLFGLTGTVVGFYYAGGRG